MTIETILSEQQIHTHYQPILHLRDGTVHGFEALTRGPEGSAFQRPLDLIDAAVKANLGGPLHRLMMERALERSPTTGDQQLFLNLCPRQVDKEELDFLLEYPLEHVVLELTEKQQVVDAGRFLEMLTPYLEAGARLAIDDFGKGFSGLDTLQRIRPNYIKIDMSLIRHIERDSYKQSLVKAMVHTAREQQTLIIAEGVETLAELKMLIHLDVTYAQGFLIGRPEVEPSPIDRSLLELIRTEQRLQENLRTYSADYHHAHSIMETFPAFSRDRKVRDIRTYFDDHPGCNGVALIDTQARPVGLLMRNRMDASLAKMHGFSLFIDRPVHLLMDDRPLVVDAYTPIQQVAKRAMDRKDDHLYDDIILTRGSTYHGMIPMKRLLDYIIRYEKTYNRELNPLTSLPGNPIINRTLRDIVTYNNETTGVFYADLDSFKVYNDKYGFERGDQIIRMTADLLSETIKRAFPYNSFVGHIGGDDFLFIIDATYGQYQRICKDITRRFDELIQPYFDAKDLARGTLTARDRDGKERLFPLTSLSIAGVYGDLKSFRSPENLAQTMGEVKSAAKRIRGSAVIIRQIGGGTKTGA